MQPTISLYLAALFLLQAAAISPPPAQRIVAVGDLHGDYPNTIEVLTMAGIVDKSEKWAGGDYTTFVQTVCRRRISSRNGRVITNTNC